MSSQDDTRPHVTALIADDDPVMRRLLRAFLERMDIVVIEAADGEQLIDECRNAKPSIVITDIQMPTMDGIAACAEIRKTYSVAELPILAISGWYDDDRMNRAAEVGIAQCLVKPIQRKTFEDHVNAALDQVTSRKREEDREESSA